MTKIELRQYEMLVRVRDFGTAQAALFPESTLATEAFATIATAVTQLSKFTGSKVMATRGSVKTKARARAALLEALGAIGRTARGIAAEDPAFQNKFQVPRRRPAPVLVTLARSFAQHAEPLTAAFVKRGMPTTFLGELNARADAFETAIRGRSVSKEDRSEAQARIQASLDSGLAAVQQLDLVVANHLREDEGLLARWTQTRYVGYRRSPKATALFTALSTGGMPAAGAPAPGVATPDLAAPSAPGVDEGTPLLDADPTWSRKAS